MRVNQQAYVPQTAIQGMKELGERISNEEFAKAEVQFQIGAISESKRFDEDSDIDTAEERHAAAMVDQLGKAAAGITDRRAREMFMIRGEEGVERSKAQMSQKITAKKNDREKGYMANAIDVMVKGGMDLEYGNPGEAALGIQLSLDSMVERGVVSRVEAEGTMRKAQLDMAHGRLKAMDPAMQLKVLDDPEAQQWLANIPADVVRGLKEDAMAHNEDNVAQDYAMSTRGMDEEDALNQMYLQASEEDWDAARVDKTRMRIMRIQQDDEVMKQRKLEDYYEEGAASIWAGESTLDQIRKTPAGIEMLKGMTRAQRLNLEDAQDNADRRAAGEGRKYSDRVVVDKLKRFMVNNQPVEMRKYWSENFARLNDSDFTYFNQAVSPKKSNEPSFKPVQTTRQVMDDYLKQYPLDDEAMEGKLWERLNDKAKRYYYDNGEKNPPPELIQTWVTDEHRNVILTPEPEGIAGIFFDGKEMLARDLPPIERAKYDQIINTYKEAGFDSSIGTLRFNEWTDDERQGFRDMRNEPEFAGMSPALFVKTYQNLVEEERAKAAAAEQGSTNRFTGRGRPIQPTL
jgi:hypothetical protein